MCDVAYLCANFSLPRPLCSRLRPDRERDVRHASSLNASALCPDAIPATTNDSHHIETADDTVFEQIFTHPNNVLAPLFPEKVGTRYQIRPRNHDWQFVPKNQ